MSTTASTTTTTRPRHERVITDLHRGIDAGRVLLTGSPYDEATALWNGAVATRPAVVVRATSAADVRHAVRVARQHSLPVSVRARGHDWAGRALREGGLAIDLRDLREVEVAADRTSALVGGGASAADLQAAAESSSRSAVTGTAGGVGIAGLTLGGGYGPLLGRFGLAADNLLAADVVLADGTQVTTDAGREPDLFWALRGGGGNFGVVTRARVRLHPVPAVVAGTILYPWAQASAVLAQLRDVLAHADDALTVQSGVLSGPDGAPVLFVAPTWSGNPQLGLDSAGPVHALTRLGAPLVAQVEVMPLSTMLERIGQQFPDGRHVAIRTRTLPDLGPSTADALIEAGARTTSPLSAISLHHFHGAATRVPVTGTAVGIRTPHVMAELIAMWEPGDDRAADHRRWADDASAALAPVSLPGGYPNLLGPDAVDQIRDAYGPNTERVLGIKKAYDPDGVFSATPLPPTADSQVRSSIPA